MKDENIIINEQEKQFAERCGLTYTGDDNEPYIGDNQSWSRFNEGEEV